MKTQKDDEEHREPSEDEIRKLVQESLARQALAKPGHTRPIMNPDKFGFPIGMGDKGELFPVSKKRSDNEKEEQTEKSE